jgi:hypothetical protein
VRQPSGLPACATIASSHKVATRVELNYTAGLKVVFLALAAILVLRYFRCGGGVTMLRMMNRPTGAMDHAAHAHGS